MGVKRKGRDVVPYTWIGKQCNKALPKEIRDKLSERATRGRPRNVEEPED